MIYLVVSLAIFCIALYVQNRSFSGERQEWARERQLLLTRIQHPEVVLPIPGPDEEAAQDDSGFMTSEPDDIDLVGTVQMSGGDGD